MSYSERAGQARELATRYGRLLGQLMDLKEAGNDFNQEAALRTVNDFEAVKANKDLLRGVTERL